MLKSKMVSCLWWEFNIHVQCPGTEVLYSPWKRSTRQDRKLLQSDKAVMNFSAFPWQTFWSAEFLPLLPAGPWEERLLLLQCSPPQPFLQQWDQLDLLIFVKCMIHTCICTAGTVMQESGQQWGETLTFSKNPFLIRKKLLTKTTKKSACFCDRSEILTAVKFPCCESTLIPLLLQQ